MTPTTPWWQRLAQGASAAVPQQPNNPWGNLAQAGAKFGGAMRDKLASRGNGPANPAGSMTNYPQQDDEDVSTKPGRVFYGE